MDVIISNNSSEPLYKQIKKQVKEAIIQGELKEGEQLPPIRAFANDLEVSVITIRRVYDELEREGFVVSQIGLGTFVSAQNLELFRESKKYLIEQKLEEVVEEGLSLGLTLEELSDMLCIIYGEAGDR